MDVFLYPVVKIQADSEADAIDMLMEAIFTARVGEIPGWCSPPPSFGEKRLRQAAPDLLAALDGLLATEDSDSGDCHWCSESVAEYSECVNPKCPGVIARTATTRAFWATSQAR